MAETKFSPNQIDTVALAADPNIDVSGKMAWKGKWDDSGSPLIPYQPNDVVLDGVWAMVATATTNDRAAPQPIGEQEYSIDPAIKFNSAFDTSVIKVVHKYTTSLPGWLDALQILTPEYDSDVVSKISVFNITNNKTEVFFNPILVADEWTTLKIDPTPFAAGLQFEIWFEYYNSSRVANVRGGWTSNENTGTPPVEEFYIDDRSNPTTLSINHVDLDGDTRSTELDGVIADSIINISETGDPARSTEMKVVSINVASPTSTEYTVTLLGQGSKGSIRDDRTCTVDIDIPLSQPSKYSQIDNYYAGSPSNQPSFATITTELYFDGVLQPITQDAYGINVRFQEAFISPNWELLALSGSSGGTSANLPDAALSYFMDITTGVGSPLGILETTLPSSWSTAYLGIGHFRITHNFNDANVGFALSVLLSGTGRVINPIIITADDITFRITDTQNSAVEGNVVGKLIF